MKDKVARWLKAGALLLTVVALSAALVACQGAVGPTGPTGADGTDGTQGPKGDPGTPGVAALQAAFEAGSKSLIVIFNNKDGTTKAVSSDIISMARFFFGGNEPDYTAKAYIAGASTEKITTTRDGETLTIEVTRETDGKFSTGIHTVELTATDLDGRSATATLTLRSNTPPIMEGTLKDIRVGVQPDIVVAKDRTKNPPDGWTCKTYDQCTASLTSLFKDTDADDILSFDAVSDAEAKLTVAVDDDKLTITGLASTAKFSSANPPVPTNVKVDQAVTVTITATDAGEFPADKKATFMVWVEGAPENVDSVRHESTYALGENLANETYTIMKFTELSGLITDHDSDDSKLIWTVTSSDDDIAIGKVLPEAKDNKTTDGLQVTVKGRGMVTLTVEAKELTAGVNSSNKIGLGQYAQSKFTFEVVKASS